MYITLGQAAHSYSISKSQLSKAIKDGKISVAEKHSDGSYRLDPAEVARFKNTMRPKPQNTSQPPAETPETPPSAVLKAQIAGLQALVESERHRAAQAEQDRDAWRDQAQRQTLLLEQRRGGLFGWFGRRSAA